MYKLTFFVVAFVMLTSCGDKKNKPEEDFTPTTSSDEGMAAPEGSAADAATYDPNRGIGKHTSVDLGAKLDEAMAAEGEKIQSVKCSSCHKLTDEKLVGPGWKGVTQRQKPEWIMNFITNPDPMIDKDPKLQAQLELCLVRMPNQALTDTDARNLLEYMRKNDGVK
ncbi:cytochrome c [Flavobacterium sp. Sr18]|uniref:c-type cytochrome n=1 Tax=Flavobacterium sp. Sr18 TaxID=935222 RepID=UPI0013E46D4A|nr:c-type cytochrome [Flavobacterium sp. Sr18]QIH40119.1 cytochrome c [Flavobacterium sp. Sr18]